MTRPTPAQLEWARRLLAHEGAADSAGEPATTAASRVYDKIHAHMAPLVGSVGVQLLFLRSAKLAKGDFECFAEVSSLEGSTKLRERLQAMEPAVTMESAGVGRDAVCNLLRAPHDLYRRATDDPGTAQRLADTRRGGTLGDKRMSDSVPIRKLSTGVPGLDDVLGGGIPEFSFNLIGGGPGSGKTTMAHQIAFTNASPERRAVYFSIIGEPPIKMLRYQQQYDFFDAAKVGDGTVRFIHLGQQALEGGMGKVLEAILQEIEKSAPSIVVVDSFRSIMRSTLATGPGGERELSDFMQRLALTLTSYEATTFLVGEYADGEQDSAVFTVADGLIWLSQAIDRNSVVRKVQVMKMRGQGQIPGLHTARITSAGYSVFPRLLKPAEHITRHPLEHRLSTGVPSLDEMLGGGIPSGYSVLIAGPSGSGKTVLSNQFIVEGALRGENGIVAIFEKRPNDYLQTTPLGQEFEKLVREKRLEVLYLRPLDLSIDETLLEIQNAVTRLGAKRAVIDSLSGLELALAPTFREDFRESLYRMMGALTGLGVTVLATVEKADSYNDLQFSPQGIAFLTDAIIIQRYVELDGQLKRAMAVVKVRSSQHSKDLREYEISSEGGIAVGRALKGFKGLLTGTPSGEDRGGG